MINFTGTGTVNPVHGAVSSQVLHRSLKQILLHGKEGGHGGTWRGTRIKKGTTDKKNLQVECSIVIQSSSEPSFFEFGSIIVDILLSEPRRQCWWSQEKCLKPYIFRYNDGFSTSEWKEWLHYMWCFCWCKCLFCFTWFLYHNIIFICFISNRKMRIHILLLV